MRVRKDYSSCGVEISTDEIFKRADKESGAARLTILETFAEQKFVVWRGVRDGNIEKDVGAGAVGGGSADNCL
jgi:hypothetical protein